MYDGGRFVGGAWCFVRYRLDCQSRRPDFVEVFLDHLANWEYAESQLK